MDIKELAARYEGEIVRYRRWYHQHPELSGSETATAAQIRADLEAMGLTPVMMQNCHGLICDIHGAQPGRTIAMRADIDALPVREETGLPFASDNGAMHACGHDAHIAMQLGAARILCALREALRGTVRLIFQPAEENATGALKMIEAGCLEGVDAVIGAHIWGELEAPGIDAYPGNRMAGCDTFTLTVEGVSAHGSAPNLGIDAVVAAASVIMNLQTCVSRVNDPIDPLVVTVGEIHGGSRFNIIANKVVMEGTVRYFSDKAAPEATMRRIAEDTAAALGAKATLEYRYCTRPVINSDPELCDLALNAVKKLDPAWVARWKPLTCSEDFCYYGEHLPSYYALIGAANHEKGIVYTNHHEKFTVDEEMLPRGSAFLAQLAADYLAK